MTEPSPRPTAPFASSATARRRGQQQARRDTAPELALRRVLHRLGLRYLVHRRPLPSLRRSADIVFLRSRVAVFVDGCFWHGCPDHGCQPRVNDWYWQPKIAGNKRRDVDTKHQLEAAGWAVVRVWEHEDPRVAAQRIEALVRIRTRHRSRG